MVLVKIASVGYVARLFGEAWEHRHRRRRRALAQIALGICLGTAALAYIIASHGQAPRSSVPLAEPAGTTTLPPSAVFTRAPYMGVNCPMANSIACDRVGLAIWLKRPAISAQAAIDGRVFTMNRRGDQLVASRRPRAEFDGYLQPGGIETSMHVRPLRGTNLWLGDSTPLATVWLLIDYGSGRYVATHLHVPLMAGWG